MRNLLTLLVVPLFFIFSCENRNPSEPITDQYIYPHLIQFDRLLGQNSFKEGFYFYFILGDEPFVTHVIEAEQFRGKMLVRIKIAPGGQYHVTDTIIDAPFYYTTNVVFYPENYIDSLNDYMGIEQIPIEVRNKISQGSTGGITVQAGIRYRGHITYLYGRSYHEDVKTVFRKVYDLLDLNQNDTLKFYYDRL